ncbi:MAG: transposase, partial [Symploca sp. SIO1C4]|nr:transposase [Symploca sp. SIO1C4]
WLKRDGKRIQRFVISTKPMKGTTISRWGKRRWQIEGFFQTVKHRFSLHRFGQKTLLGVYRWLILSLISYLLAYWVYLYFDNPPNLDWFYYGQ